MSYPTENDITNAFDTVRNSLRSLEILVASQRASPTHERARVINGIRHELDEEVTALKVLVIRVEDGTEIRQGGL